ncbi:MAG: hypothetical protein KY443_05375 [Actinobacteria bacterium]|nr:hypothetical protein [Actinomycetota bacterium]
MAGRPVASVPDLGMRHVRWVSIERAPEGLSCQVGGIGHRTPVVRHVTPATAAALVARGVPLVVHRKSA